MTRPTPFATLPTLAAVTFVGACAQPVPTEFTDGGPDIPAEVGTAYTWDFDADTPGELPAGFFNVLGEWAAVESGMKQAGSFGGPDYPRVIVEHFVFTDLAASVRCRVETGDTDRACGLMFRAVDSENYFITRANALEDNVRLYRVVDGDRQQFASADVTVSSGEWHDLSVTARGDELTVSWDGTTVITASDATFTSGKLGLWTKADSVTSFDDLQATAE